MKAHNGISPLKQLKQLCIVVAVLLKYNKQVWSELVETSAPLTEKLWNPNSPEKKGISFWFYHLLLWRKNNLNCELNSSFATAAIYVLKVVQYFLSGPVEDSSL